MTSHAEQGPDGAGWHSLPIERLTTWLAANLQDFRGPLRAETFVGGQSNPTYRLSAASGDYVLRRKPAGTVLPSAHAVDREFRVLRAVAGAGVPVPRAHVLCADPTVIGSIFYIMDLVPGRIFWDPRLVQLSRQERQAIFESMNRTIAAIHDIDPEAVGLGDFGPRSSYLARQVARWTKQYRASQTAINPAMERLIEWLPQHMPPEGQLRLVHGDFRLDNVLIHPTEPHVVAVLDWELATLGDPMADFAYHAMSWRISPELFRGLAGTDFAATGIPSEAEYLSSYLRRRELPQSDHWEFYIILSLFRIASILQGIARRAMDGTAANADAAEVGQKAFPLSALAWDLASRIDR